MTRTTGVQAAASPGSSVEHALVVELRKRGVDVDQLIAHARLTPEQRLALLKAYVVKMRQLRRAFVETAQPASPDSHAR